MITKLMPKLGGLNKPMVARSSGTLGETRAYPDLMLNVSLKFIVYW